MTKIDLITGFLGAGKTTFLKYYAGQLLRQGMKIGILVYDHGAVNVDIPMLQELRSESCELESIIGDCDAESHRRRFRTKLIAMGMSGYDRILIEPSGVFDMDEFFDVLNDPPLDRWFEAGSVITVVNARLEEELPREADFYLASQAAWAGRIVLSRVQLASQEEIGQTLMHLDAAVKKIHGDAIQRERILCRDWRDLSDRDLTDLMDCGYVPADYVKTIAGRGTGFTSLSYLDPPLTAEGLKEASGILFGDERYGKVFRVKGFLREEDRFVEINATAKDFLSDEVAETRCAVIIIGSDLQEEEIRNVLWKS